MTKLTKKNPPFLRGQRGGGGGGGKGIFYWLSMPKIRTSARKIISSIEINIFLPLDVLFYPSVSIKVKTMNIEKTAMHYSSYP